ncbi:hypothetical protein ACLOJK_032031 [Asimina triloba]
MGRDNWMCILPADIFRHKSINYPSNRSNSARNTVRVPASSCREERFRWSGLARPIPVQLCHVDFSDCPRIRHQTLAEYPKQGNPTHPTPPYLLSLRRFPSAPSPILQLTSASPSPNHRWKMLCSISAGKSDSTWLDRLRTSKGFPTQNGLDLDHFLNPNPNLKPIPDQNHAAAAIPEASDKSIVDRRKKSSTSPAPSMAAEKNSEDWFDIMSCVLSELFNMGDASRVPALESRTKKSSRKQPNPRICALSASASVDDSCLAGVPAMSPSSVDNSVAEAKEPRKQGVAECVNPEDEILQVVGADTDLSSFSRSEVTIIDTSAPVWKSEKLIYRKGNVWKIREKKRNSWNGSASRKKRKLGQRDGSGGEDMQQKPPISPSALVKEAGNNGHFVSSHEENDRESEVQSFNKHIDLGYCSDLLKEKITEEGHKKQEYLKCVRSLEEKSISALGEVLDALGFGNNHDDKREASKDIPENPNEVPERRQLINWLLILLISNNFADRSSPDHPASQSQKIPQFSLPIVSLQAGRLMRTVRKAISRFLDFSNCRMLAPLVIFHRSFGALGFLEFLNRRSSHPSSSSANLRLLPHRRPPSASPSSSPSASPLPSPSSSSFCCLSLTRRSLCLYQSVVHRHRPCCRPPSPPLPISPVNYRFFQSSFPADHPLLPCGPADHRLLKSSSTANHRFIQSSSTADHLLLLSAVPTARKTSADSISIPHSADGISGSVAANSTSMPKNRLRAATALRVLLQLWSPRHNGLFPRPERLTFGRLVKWELQFFGLIGIDVEEKQRELRNNILSFARRYFSPHEVDYLQAFSDPEIQRQELVKFAEAYVKAIGRGFSAAPFSSFTLCFRAGKRMKNPRETSSNRENNLKGNESGLLRLKVWKTLRFVDDTLVSGTDAVNFSDVKEATRDGEPTVEMTLSGIGLFLTWMQDHYDSLAIVVRAA